MAGENDGYGASVFPAPVGSQESPATGTHGRNAGGGIGHFPAPWGSVRYGHGQTSRPVGRSGPLVRDRSRRHNGALGRARS